MTLKEVIDALGGKAQYRWPIRLFNNIDGQLLKNTEAILKTDYLDRFEVVSVSFNEMLMTYDIRIAAREVHDDN